MGEIGACDETLLRSPERFRLRDLWILQLRVERHHEFVGGLVVDPPQAPPSPDLVERFTTLAGFMAEHTPTEEHWYLQLLATHPDWQRRGLGTTLMASMFERTDAEGLPCYLETETEVNVAYYRHHGFEVRSEWDVTEGPHMWGMLRPVH